MPRLKGPEADELAVLLREGDLADQTWRRGSTGSLGFLLDRVGELRLEMHPDDHPPPHFHVEFSDGKQQAKFAIADCALLQGTVDGWAQRAVRKWWSGSADYLKSKWDEARPTDRSPKTGTKLPTRRRRK